MRVNKSNYFDDTGHMSVSRYILWNKCPAMAAGGYRQPDSTALLVGSYVDAWCEGEKAFKDFREANWNEIFTKTTGMPKADFQRADRVIDQIEGDPFFRRFLSGKPQAIVTGKIGGVLWKGRIDFLHDDKIVDLKVVKDFDFIWDPITKTRRSFIEHWGYDIQAAVYQKLEGGGKPFYIAAATKEPIPRLEVIEIPQAMMDAALELVEMNLPYIMKLKAMESGWPRCEGCAYCLETRKLEGVLSYEEFKQRHG